jgi:hypothetical protein
MTHILPLFLALFVSLPHAKAASPAAAATYRLQFVIAECDVEKAKALFEKGADANGKDLQGKPLLKWLASNQRCTDATALATAKLLDEHGAHWAELPTNPSLLSGLAHKKFSETLAFLAGKKAGGDPTAALHASARTADLATVQALLAAGADPLEGVALSSALFDAAAEGRDELVREMLLHVKDKQAEKVVSAYRYAEKSGNTKVAAAFREAGVKLPAAPAIVVKCQRHELTSEQRALMKKAGIADNRECKFIGENGDLVLIDCNSAADGPAFYLDKKTEKVVATCGGACMGGCTGCPPKEWKGECAL